MKKIIGLAAVARSGKDTVANILLSNENVAAYALADPLKSGCQHLFGLTDAQTWEDNYKEVEIPLWGRSPRQLFQEVGTEWMRNHNPEFWLMRADREINGAPGSTTPAFPQGYSSPKDSIMFACEAFFGFTSDQVRDAELSNEVDPFWGTPPAQALALIEKLTLQSFPDWYAIRPQAKSEMTIAPKHGIQDADTIIIKDVRFENEANFIRSHNGEIWHIVRPNAQKVNVHSSEAGISSKPEDRTILNNGSLDDLSQKVIDAWDQFKL
ncbi:deoxynucleotide monophosphate kinase [Pseudomonas sp.]|uniref:deoxynucleotide monophosphate kinase family protein n=1 Tax=Pseudomonas sp. TaxID=306 RepID=UPI00248758C1|nr:deoxynucleotide monophosphate kinase [Pseudomonas sp.]MDI1333145.1 deoxynucleotide monophosphate kinase [Pseudomonas sp.]